MRHRRNPDSNIRNLERLARLGDPEAIQKLLAVKSRVSDLPEWQVKAIELCKHLKFKYIVSNTRRARSGVTISEVPEKTIDSIASVLQQKTPIKDFNKKLFTYFDDSYNPEDLHHHIYNAYLLIVEQYLFGRRVIPTLSDWFPKNGYLRQMVSCLKTIIKKIDSWLLPSTKIVLEKMLALGPWKIQH